MSDPTGIAPRRIRVTLALLGLCLAVFVAMVATGTPVLEPTVHQLIRWGANFGPRTLNGEWWRLGTSMFVHIGVLHLLLNGFCLLQLGMLAEVLLGARRFAALYLLSGLGGSLLSLAIHPMTVSAGASGAIFGVAGGLIALYRRNVAGPLPSVRSALKSIVPFVLYNLIAGLRPGIDNAGHIGGLATGLLLGALLPLPATPGGDPMRRRSAVALGGVTALLVTAGVAVFRYQAPVGAFGAGAHLLDAGNAAAALPYLRTVAAERPRFAVGQYSLGVALLQLDSAQLALGPLREATRLDSSDADYVEAIGLAFYHLRHWDSASVRFARVSQLDPSSWPAAFNGGLALMNDDQPAKAIGRFRSAMALAPDSGRFRRIFGEACLAADSAQVALTVFAAVLERHPDDAVAHYYRGVAYERLGDIARARSELGAVLATTDPSADVQSLMSEARHMLDHLGH